eukprot:6183513-Pleurochrysis_carterae.AAC.1
MATPSRSWAWVGPAGPNPSRAASTDATTAPGDSGVAFITFKRACVPAAIKNFADPTKPSSGLSVALPNRVPACKKNNNMGFSDELQTENMASLAFRAEVIREGHQHNRLCRALGIAGIPRHLHQTIVLRGPFTEALYTQLCV